MADKLLRDYYDAEWGMPVTDERGLFEALSLEAFQVGLSWRTILARREAFRRAFEGFNPERVAAFTDQDVARLLQDEEIIRNERKIRAVISNAQLTLRMRELAATPHDASAEDVHLPLITHSSTPPNTDSVEAPNARRVEFVRSAMKILTGCASAPYPTARVYRAGCRRGCGPSRRTRLSCRIPWRIFRQIHPSLRFLPNLFKALGGVFLGPVTAYALMCAVGMVDAHLVGSHRRGCSGLFT